jgi:hypothetical protein
VFENRELRRISEPEQRKEYENNYTTKYLLNRGI